jgi:4-hydroxybenzoate polyprenyltransferase
MLLFRWVMLLSLLACAGLFVMYAVTGQQKYKKNGLNALKITLGIAFVFFIILILQRL